MASDLATLYQVQQVDTRLQELEHEREALDPGAELRTQVAALRVEGQTARGEMRVIENELRDTELQIKTQEAKKRDFESRMYSGRVRNPKELDDMQQEVEMLGVHIDKLEDKGLDLMEQAERQRTRLSEQATLLKEQEARLSQIEEHYQTETARIAEEVRQLQARRAQLLAALPRDLVRRYDDLRAKRANLAIVKLTSDICPGCRIAIPSDTVRQLKRGDHTILCESCGRILYWEESQQSTEHRRRTATQSGVRRRTRR